VVVVPGVVVDVLVPPAAVVVVVEPPAAIGPLVTVVDPSSRVK
jgi:hypothetical protein